MSGKSTPARRRRERPQSRAWA